MAKPHHGGPSSPAHSESSLHFPTAGDAANVGNQKVLYHVPKVISFENEYKCPFTSDLDYSHPCNSGEMQSPVCLLASGPTRAPVLLPWAQLRPGQAQVLTVSLAQTLASSLIPPSVSHMAWKWGSRAGWGPRLGGFLHLKAGRQDHLEKEAGETPERWRL